MQTIVKWSDIRKEVPSLPNVREILNERIQIIDVDFIETEFGIQSILKLADGREYQTRSKVLQRQLKQVKDFLNSNNKPLEIGIITRESQNGRVYYTLV